MIYSFLKHYFGFLLSIYYKNVSVHGIKNIPDKGPVLIYSNHPNSLIDPLLIISSVNRKVTLTASSMLGSIPLLGRLLRKLNVQLIHRRQDGHSEKIMNKNNQTIQTCAKILQDQNILLIFPEGRSYPGNNLRRFKTGTARIVKEYNKNNTEPLTILPVYIDYRGKSSFRSRVIVNFLPPIVPVYESVNSMTEMFKLSLLVHSTQTKMSDSDNKRRSSKKSIIFGLQVLILSLFPMSLIYLLSGLVAKKEEQYDTARIALSFLLLPILYVIQLVIVFSQISLAIFGLISLISVFFNLLSFKVQNRIQTQTN